MAINLPTISKDKVRQIAALASLKLSENELSKYQKQIAEILKYISILNEVDTKNVIPTTQATGLKNAYREDVVKDSLSQTEALSGAKTAEKGYFKTKGVLSKNG